MCFGIVFFSLFTAGFFSEIYFPPQNRILLIHSVGFSFFSLILLLVISSFVRKLQATNRIQKSFFHLYQSVLASLEVGIAVLDSNKDVKFMNPACYRILQRTHCAQDACLSFSDLLYPVLVPVSAKLTSAIENKESFSREFRVFLPEGIRCFQCDLLTLEEEGLDQVHVLSIEDRTREDDVKRKLSQQLEETHRFAASKDNFFANMSHEIRTPINAILGMTYLAKNSAQDPKCFEYIQKIEGASSLLLCIVNDILDFSKMQEHKFTLKSENFNLAYLKKVLVDLFELKAESKGLTLSVNFDFPEIFYVYGDQFRLTQVFINLISNAIKFTDVGFISVFINHECIGNDVILRCTVRDTGCGLNEDELFHLFTDFAQFEKVLVKSHEGTGLGLAISKRLVELMQGVIWVDSMPGKGSSFHFVVVLSKPEAESIVKIERTLPKITRINGRILVVEDNEINAEIAGTLLIELGCIVEYARDGIDAIEKCRCQCPDYYDLILMDIHMPRMNGYDAARILKVEHHVRCPILAVTANNDTDVSIEGNSDYIAGYILKPYSPSVFKQLLGNI